MAGRPRHLFLFDVDSVLVEAIGYLKALQDSVALFTRLLGAGAHPPTEAEARTFEAKGLTSEWDSGAACVGLVLAERLLRDPGLSPPPSWDGAAVYLGQRPRQLGHPDYGGLAAGVEERLDARTTSAEAAKGYVEDRYAARAGLAGRQEALSRILEDLLAHTHEFHQAAFTRYLQHLVIGSEAIPSTYGVPAEFSSYPYLARHDRALLAPSYRVRVRRAVAEGAIGAAIYTARPSLPPFEAAEDPLGYSPEAEAARDLVGLEGLPLIGAGSVRWLARDAGEEVERLVKPSPVQALAAIGAAASGSEANSLRAAIALHRDGELLEPLAGLQGAAVHVFEDTVGGLSAVERAVGELQSAGLDVGYEPYGVVVDGPKVAAMAGRGVATYTSVNEALVIALERVG